MSSPPKPAAPGRRPATPTHAAPRRLDSRELLGSEREIEIVHHDSVYRLRCTEQGKLILTK